MSIEGFRVEPYEPTGERYPLDGLHRAMRSGSRIHAFLSGGGLRVVRLEGPEGLQGYGEHPDVLVALRHCEEDFAAGGRDYNAVYGENGTETGYLTGMSVPSGPLDAWVRKGSTFDVSFDGQHFVAVLHGYGRMDPPQWAKERIFSRRFAKVQWTDRRGFSHEGTASRFANGERCMSIQTLNPQKGRDASFYQITKTGRGTSFWAASDTALAAKEVG